MTFQTCQLRTINCHCQVKRIPLKRKNSITEEKNACLKEILLHSFFKYKRFLAPYGCRKQREEEKKGQI